MTFHIRALSEDHPFWSLIEDTVAKTVDAACPWLDAPIDDTDEYVHGLGAAVDFVYVLSDLGRIRREIGEVHTIDYNILIENRIANDEVVRKAVHKAIYDYRYRSYDFGSDAEYEDVNLNALCVERVYATLMNAGYVSHYERQEHTVTTKQVKV